MHIVVATPLFPPDIGAPAPYVKELVSRLKNDEVFLVFYGHLPEAVAAVSFFVVSKRVQLLVRLYRYTAALYTVAKKADVIFAQNGPSVEFPAAMVSIVTRTPLIFCISDPVAYMNRNKSFVHRVIHEFAERQATETVMLPFDNESSVLERPEILPFTPHPTKALAQYEKAWEKHLSEITRIFTHVSK